MNYIIFYLTRQSSSCVPIIRRCGVRLSEAELVDYSSFTRRDKDESCMPIDRSCEVTDGMDILKRGNYFIKKKCAM